MKFFKGSSAHYILLATRNPIDPSVVSEAAPLRVRFIDTRQKHKPRLPVFEETMEEHDVYQEDSFVYNANHQNLL